MQANDIAEALKELAGNQLVSFDSIHKAIMEAAAEHRQIENSEAPAAQTLHWYLDKLTTAAAKHLGADEPPMQDVAPPVKKKRKNKISPEARAAAAQRMRDMQARKRAEREQRAA